MFKKRLTILLFLLAPNLYADAEAKKILTIYSPDSFAASWGLGPAIKSAFEAECDCQLNILGLSDGASVLNRLRMEGKNTQADLIIGLDNSLLTAAEQTGLFAKHHTDTSALILNGGWDNPYFVPFDYSYFAFIYNKERIKQPPTTMQALIEGNWSVIYQDPRTSTPGFGLLMWIEKLYGQQSAQAWQKLTQHTVTVTKGWSDAYNLFLKGEADLVLSYTTSPIYHILEENDYRYAAAEFSEGHYRQIEVAGILASSQQPQLAQRFIQFMLSPQFQQHVLQKNAMYPVIDMSLPAAVQTVYKPTQQLEFLPEQVAKSRANWIDTWQTAVSQ